MPEAPAPLAPGATIGILGGGQLGRMLAIAAARLGFSCHIYEPAAEAPAAAVAAARTRAGWEDAAALDAFAAAVDVVTYEFENVPVAAVERLAARVPVRPSARSLAAAQDRLEEKTFLAGLGLRTAGFRPVASAGDAAAAVATLGGPAILKTRRMGYDGKGQVRVATPSEAAAGFAALGSVPAIMEAVVPFEAELSVIGARGLSGAVACFDPVRNAHRDGILRRSTVPAGLPRGLLAEAVLATGRILNALDHVGVIGVEFFAAPDGLRVNEFAPRVHNSGHWTIEACLCDQFQQHIRAVAGWPIMDGARHSDAEMENLIGAEADGWAHLSGEPGTALHLYGKGEARPGRKMGHVTRISPRG